MCEIDTAVFASRSIYLCLTLIVLSGYINTASGPQALDFINVEGMQNCPNSGTRF